MENYEPEVYTRDGLTALSIYELRELARSLGVVSPTSKDKQVIVEEILEIVYGENYDSLENFTKGRPNKHRRETDWVEILKYNNGFDEVFYGKLDRNFAGAHSFVASSGSEYVNDAEMQTSGEDEGVVFNENYQYVVRSFKSSGFNKALKLPFDFVEKHNLSPGDVVQYNYDGDKIVKINNVEKIRK